MTHAHENMEKAFKDEEADERKEWLNNITQMREHLIWIHRIKYYNLTSLRSSMKN